MKPKVYLETTIVSYLTARPSRDLITAAHQQITQQWWHTQRARFDLFVAPPVMQEAQAGDPDAAAVGVPTGELRAVNRLRLQLASSAFPFLKAL